MGLGSLPSSSFSKRSKLSAPLHLTTINWEDNAHQRAVASSLINALYVHLDDCKAGRQGSKRWAPKWWSFFGFEPAEPLIDSNSSSARSYFGAVFRRIGPSTPPSAPAIVVAIRGMKTPRDWNTAINSWAKLLDTRTCFKALMEALDRYTDEYHHDEIWLCGHSLGATLATGAGQEMAKRGIPLKTFLFNPPYILDPTTKNLFAVDLGKALGVLAAATMAAGPIGFVAAGSLFAGFHGAKAIVKHIVRDEEEDEELYHKMRSWVPFIFVNKEDFICRDYIKYFEKRKMKASPHLPVRIASAVLVRNLDPRASTYPDSHGIQQWWLEKPRVQAKECIVGDDPQYISD